MAEIETIIYHQLALFPDIEIREKPQIDVVGVGMNFDLEMIRFFMKEVRENRLEFGDSGVISLYNLLDKYSRPEKLQQMRDYLTKRIEEEMAKEDFEYDMPGDKEWTINLLKINLRTVENLLPLS